MAQPTLTFNMELKGLNNILKAVDKSAVTLNDKLGKAITDGTQKYKQAMNELQANPFQKAKFHTELAKLKSDLQRAAVAKVKLNMEEAKAKIAGLKGEIIAAVASVGALATPIKSAMDFESAMADVRKVVDFDTPAELKGFSNELIKMSTAIPLSAQGLSQIAASGAQMGIAKNDLMKFTDMAAKVAVAFDISTEAAGDSIGKIKNILGLSIDGTGGLMDAINHLSNKNAAKAGEIVEVMKRIGGIGKQVGITKEQTAALATSFIALGKAPETAATASEALLKKLNNIKSATPKAQDAFEQLGFNIQEFANVMKKDAQGGILMFLERLQKVEPQKRGALLTAIMGLNYDSDIATLVSGIDVYKNALNEVSDPANFKNSALKEFESKSNTTAHSLQLFKNSIQSISISIGNIFLPYVNKALLALRDFGIKIRDFIQNNESLVKNLGFAVAGLVSAKTAFLGAKLASAAATFSLNGYRQILMLLPFNCLKFGGSLRDCNLKLKAKAATLKITTFASNAYAFAIGKVSRTAALMSIGIKSVSAALRLLKVALIGSGIGAIAVVLGTAAVAVYQNWDKVKSFFSGFFEGLSAALAPVSNAFSSAFAPLKPIWNWVSGIFSALFTNVSSTSKELQNAKNAGVAFGEAVGKAINFLLTPLTWVIEKLGYIIDLAKQATQTFSFDSIGNIWDGFFGSDEPKQPQKPTTHGTIENLKTQQAKTLSQTNSKMQTINDYSTTNITAQTNATPEQIAQKVKASKNSYSLNDSY